MLSRTLLLLLLLSVGCAPAPIGADDDDARDDDDSGDDDDDFGDDDDSVNGDGDGDGWLAADGDCDDGDPDVHPGATEVCDGVDTDCDGVAGPDADGDGTPGCESWSCALGWPWNGDCRDYNGDCDDADPAVHAFAAEVCDGGRDNDCNPVTVESCPANDADGDGLSGAQDANDELPFPVPPEVNGDGVLWPALVKTMRVGAEGAFSAFSHDLMEGFEDAGGAACPELVEDPATYVPPGLWEGEACEQDLALVGCAGGTDPGTATFDRGWSGPDKQSESQGESHTGTLTSTLALASGTHSLLGTVDWAGGSSWNPQGWFSGRSFDGVIDLEVTHPAGASIHRWLSNGTTTLEVDRDLAHTMVSSPLGWRRQLDSAGTRVAGGVAGTWTLAWGEQRRWDIWADPEMDFVDTCLNNPVAGTVSVTDGVNTLSAVWDSGVRCTGCAELALDGVVIGEWCPEEVRLSEAMAVPALSPWLDCP